MNFSVKKIDYNIGFFIKTSLIITIIVFVVFLGQKVFSDVVTFGILGDQLQLCYPGFIKTGNNLISGKFQGIDMGIFNGATEFYLVPNVCTRYPIFMLFSVLGAFTSKYRFFYILFHVFHLFVSLFYLQLLCNKYFKLEKNICLIIASTSLTLFLYEMWSTGFAIISMLSPIIIYFSLNLIDSHSKRDIFLTSFIIYLGFMSGYIQYSLFLVAISFSFTFIYGFICSENFNKKRDLIKIFVPYCIAGIVAFPFYLGVLIYIKTVVKTGLTNLFHSLELTTRPDSILSIISNSFDVNRVSTEQMQIINIGIIWTMLIFLFLFKMNERKFILSERVFIIFSLIMNFLFLLIHFGTPIGAIFYSIVPILGQGHLHIRYMMITLPYLYIALGIILKKIDFDINGYIIKKSSVVLFLLSIIISIFYNIIPEGLFNKNIMIMELFFSAIVLLVFYREKEINKVSTLFFCFYMIIFPLNHFYHSINTINYDRIKAKELSIVNDYESVNKIDDFISSNIEKKAIYRFLNIDEENFVPEYLPSNLEWYRLLKNKITNYSGYPLHVALPYDYRNFFGVFDSFNEGYILSTRADFSIVNSQNILKNADLLDKITDTSVEPVYLNSKYKIIKLKKFVVSNKDGQTKITEDNRNTLDNGYFYCPNLTNDDIISFKTDDSSKYLIEIHSNKSTNVDFLPYANRYYKYKVNGNYVEPKIENMKATLYINQGNNRIEVYYDNILEKIFILINCLYGVSLIVVFIFRKGKK